MTTRETGANLFHIATVLGGLAQSDVATVDMRDQLSSDNQVPIEGPAPAPEKARLDPNEKAGSVQEGAAKNPDPPEPTQTATYSASAEFPQPELAAGGKPGPSAETGTYSTNSSMGEQASYSVDLSNDFNAPPPPSPPPPPEEKKSLSEEFNRVR